MGKKDGFKDIWCENRSVSKCNSRTRIWNDSSIPAIEYKHSDACRMKKKREKESNQVSQSINQQGKRKSFHGSQRKRKVEILLRKK